MAMRLNKLFIEDVAFEQADRRNANAFGIAGGRLRVEGARHRTAHVGPMDHRAGEGNDLIVKEDRADKPRIVDMRAGPVGIGKEKCITAMHRIHRAVLEQLDHRRTERRVMSGRIGMTMRDQPAIPR